MQSYYALRKMVIICTDNMYTSSLPHLLSKEHSFLSINCLSLCTMVSKKLLILVHEFSINLLIEFVVVPVEIHVKFKFTLVQVDVSVP